MSLVYALLCAIMAGSISESAIILWFLERVSEASKYDSVPGKSL